MVAVGRIGKADASTAAFQESGSTAALKRWSTVRLNKYLADCGVGARRKADALIAAGAVTVDGRLAILGESVDPGKSLVRVRGAIVRRPSAAHVTIVLNKPLGVVTTMHDERGRDSVARFMPQSGRRMFPVGRLDAQTTGVLLCTSDGDLCRLLTHPKFEVERRYRVRVRGEMSAEIKAALGARDVTRLPDGTYQFDLSLFEGKNRQVRRMCATLGLAVETLTRTRYGPVELRGLAPGKTRALTAAENSAMEQLRARAERSSTKVESRPQSREGRSHGPQNERGRHGGSRDPRGHHGPRKHEGSDRRRDGLVAARDHRSQ
jgi:23S rRNA pseudouridine2605 synthase